MGFSEEFGGKGEKESGVVMDFPCEVFFLSVMITFILYM